MPTLLCEKGAGVIINNIAVPGFPNRFYTLYIPADVNVQQVIIGLHGGGGDSGTFAAQIGLIKVNSEEKTGFVRWKPLQVFATAVALLNGSACNGTVSEFNPNGLNTFSPALPNGIPTWASYDFFAQDDDKAVLEAMCGALMARFDVVGCNLGGHSLGAICGQMIYQRPQKLRPDSSTQSIWRRFMSLCGPRAIDCPLSETYTPGPGEIIAKRPYFQQYGGLDENLCTFNGPAGAGSHFYDAEWLATTANFGPLTYRFPLGGKRAGAFADLQTIVDQWNTLYGLPPETVQISDGVTTPLIIGEKTLWSYASGRIQLQVNTAASHKPSTFARGQNRYTLAEWLIWIAATPVNPP